MRKDFDPPFVINLDSHVTKLKFSKVATLIIILPYEVTLNVGGL